MTVEQVTRGYYILQQKLVRSVVRDVTRLWKRVDRDNIERSWVSDRLGEQVFVTVASGQAMAAAQADDYTDRVLAEQGTEITPAGRVNPNALAGVASDGRPLETLLYLPAITTRAQLAAGATVDEAFGTGLGQLVQMAATQVQDASRAAESVAVAARPTVKYVRMLNPPSCSRCAILAGAVYRWNDGFLRHPMCDCRHIPTTESTPDDLTVNPRSYFDSLPEDQQDRVFTKSGAQAIRDGADIGQVVNARRGMASTVTASGRRRQVADRSGRLTTRAGTRGRTARGPRLMPEQIYADASSRDGAVELLRAHGYLR